MRVLMIFLDGWGIGERDPAQNPYCHAHTPVLDRLLGGHILFRGVGIVEKPDMVLIPTDTSLGIPGIPQSATGQTTLWTGINAARVVGRHVHAFPDEELRSIIARHSIMKVLRQRNKKVTFANAYRPEYFEGVRRGKYRHSTSTLIALSGGVRLRTIEDLKKGKAVYQEFTNRLLQEMGFNIEVISPRTAGGRLARLSVEYDFTLYEYFITDRVGHAQDMKKAVKVLQALDEFIGEVLLTIDLVNTMVIITSDHGNIEDVSVKTHTLNPVPTIIVTRDVQRFYPLNISSLQDISRLVLRVLNAEGEAVSEPLEQKL